MDSGGNFYNFQPFILSHCCSCTNYALLGPALYYDMRIYRYVVYGIMSFGPLCGVNKPAVVGKFKNFNIYRANFSDTLFSFSVHTSRCVPRMDQIKHTPNAEFLFNFELRWYFIYSGIRETIKLDFVLMGTFYIDILYHYLTFCL